MNKKIILVLLTVLLMFIGASCTSYRPKETKEEPTPERFSSWIGEFVFDYVIDSDIELEAGRFWVLRADKYVKFTAQQIHVDMNSGLKITGFLSKNDGVYLAIITDVKYPYANSEYLKDKMRYYISSDIKDNVKYTITFVKIDNIIAYR